MIVIKNEDDIKAMREAGAVANTILREVAAFVQPGKTTKELDDFAAERIAFYGCKSAFLGYRNYPCNICISVNEEVVHGIASLRALLFGDIVSLDVGVCYSGFVGDNALTAAVGGCGVEDQKLLDVTEKSLFEGISKAVVGNRVCDISRAVQGCVEGNGMSVVREFVGHGVGRSVHEEPQIPNFFDGGKSPKLKAGMTLAIEPMVNLGSAQVEVLSDGWTVLTRDGRRSAHFEHTILVTDGEPKLLTCPENMPSALKARLSS
ncbi:MAG: Methionine aminopeptidase 1 [Verrucomicrobia subdivision 3 bacterium]|nr:Methionine aminopeptidase 1 [Limisphaerales bacterium]MCS1415982.1 Methionine aminopeptidase 1 [Limisphaerales bacterium]